MLPAFADRCGWMRCLLYTVAHLLSTKAGGGGCLHPEDQRFDVYNVSITSSCCIGGGHTHIQSRAASWDSGGSEKICRSGMCFCESSGLCGDAWVRKFESTKDGVDARILSPSGFDDAAEFSVLKLGVQESSTQTALATARPSSVAKSLPHIGDVVMWRKDTLCARVPGRQSLSLAAKHLLGEVFPSDPSAVFCQTTARAALGAAMR